MNEQVTAHISWIGKLFGSRFSTITVSDTAVVLTDKRGEICKISWDDATPAEVENHWFTASLTVETHNQRHTIKGLTKNDAADIQQASLLGFFTFKNKAAGNAVSKIHQQLDKIRYLRTSYVEKIAEFACSELAKLSVSETISWAGVPSTITDALVILERWSQHDERLIDGYRQRYIQQEKTAHQAFFDTLESNPLTERQREACIIDEDNNLVLAGAGTGKTSTMVGRVGYLLTSEQATEKQVLMLAFGNKAAQEMRERVAEKLNQASITACTFHVLGQSIITKVEGIKPSISALASDEKAFGRHVDAWFNECLSDPHYQATAIDYFEQYLYPAANPFDFKTLGEYIEYLRANEIRTLKGEEVKSFEECLIANWLFMRGIEYRYEARYQEADTRSPDFRPYKPDFYLPDYSIYIEHFGVDRDGNTAPYVDRQGYHEGMEWKRALHAAHETSLIETFHYEQREGCLLTELERKLLEAGVTLNPLPEDAILDTLREFGAMSKFAVLLSSMLRQYRANCLDESALNALVERSSFTGQLNAAMRLLLPIVKRYEDYLAERDEIDFEEMIGRALRYVEQGEYRSHWKYILVDEFQDISEPRARLVKALRDSRVNSSLFCVGDDWQAIYRFTGSDVTLTTGFEALFGPTRTTALDRTFRFNNQISDVASAFVMRNPAQVKKTITTHDHVDAPAVSLVRQAIHNDDVIQHLPAILDRIEARTSDSTTVYVLARYWFRLPDRQALRELEQRYPKLTLECHTFHASKGKEADYVIILGLDNGKHGFPSHKTTHPLLEALLPPQEDYPDAEERRLLYVAITRARHRCYLLVDMTRASGFVKELYEQDYALELDEFEADITQCHTENRTCPVCTTGTLVQRQSGYGRFMGCTNYPWCEHTESTCNLCRAEMMRIGEYRVCVSDQCKGWVPVCPRCGGDLVLRQRKFWGCSNYPQGCRHTKSYIESPYTTA